MGLVVEEIDPGTSTLFQLLFNIYMKSLGEDIHQHGVQYYQHIDETQLHISTMGQPDAAGEVLSQCLEVLEELDGGEQALS